MHTDIDGAASNGTTMTIKALTNMYLLLHLMDREQAGRVRLPHYLDEAADIDEAQPGRAAGDQPATGLRADPGEREAAGFRTRGDRPEGGSGPNGIYIDEADWKYIRRRDAAASGETRAASELEEAGEPA